MSKNLHIFRIFHICMYIYKFYSFCKVNLKMSLNGVGALCKSGGRSRINRFTVESRYSDLSYLF